MDLHRPPLVLMWTTDIVADSLKIVLLQKKFDSIVHEYSIGLCIVMERSDIDIVNENDKDENQFKLKIRKKGNNSALASDLKSFHLDC